MCDLEPCIDSYLTILNIDIPEILKNNNNYVVKGGRAFDYYTYTINGQKMIHLTDWDIACTPSNCDQLKNTILEYLKQKHNLNFIQQNISLPGEKNGTQIGFKCASNECYFVDLVKYESDDSIFTNIVKNDNINFISREYMLNDLRETYKDRKDALIESLPTFGIDLSRITFENYSNDYKNVEDDIMKGLLDEYNRNVDETTKRFIRRSKNPQLDIEELEIELKEDLDDIKDRFEKNILSVKEETLHDLKEKFLKFYRTKTRYDILNPTGGRRKTKTLKKRKSKRKTRKY